MPLPSFVIIGRTFLRNLVGRRALIANLVARDFRQRYIGSSIGWMWGIVHPAVLLASYTFVFSIVLKVGIPPGAGTESFALYVFTGVLPWLLFQETVQRSSTAMVDYSNLITKTVFPSEVLPISILCGNLLNHLLGLAVLLSIAVLPKEDISPLLALLPLYLALLGLFTLGVSWMVSGLHVFLRDTSQALSILMTFWFWSTPIFFPLERLPEEVRFLGRLNPLAQVVEAYRRSILAGQRPAGRDLAILAGISLATFVAGGLFFRHSKRAFGDVL